MACQEHLEGAISQPLPGMVSSGACRGALAAAHLGAGVRAVHGCRRVRYRHVSNKNLSEGIKYRTLFIPYGYTVPPCGNRFEIS